MKKRIDWKRVGQLILWWIPCTGILFLLISIAQIPINGDWDSGWSWWQRLICAEIMGILALMTLPYAKAIINAFISNDTPEDKK